MDYSDWLDRLREFLRRWQDRLPVNRRGECYLQIEPPLTLQQVTELRQQLDCPLPPAVEAFLTQTAARVSFSRTCNTVVGSEIHAGGDLFHYWLGWANGMARWEGCPEGMVEARQWVSDWATSDTAWLAESECVLDRAFWCHGLPLTQMPNGDCLALWAHDPNDLNPAVVHLRHDANSYILSPTFDDFLTQWEQLAYQWGEEYLDPDSRLLTASSPAGVERRCALGLASHPNC